MLKNKIKFDERNNCFSVRLKIFHTTLLHIIKNDNITGVAKSEACKLGFLFGARRVFTSTQVLSLYKAQIRICLEYGRVCGEEYSLATLDAI